MSGKRMSAVVQAIAGPPQRSHVALAAGAPARLFAFDASGATDLGRFAREVRAVAELLPAAGFAVNLCEDRYNFAFAFCASMTSLSTPVYASRSTSSRCSASRQCRR